MSWSRADRDVVRCPRREHGVFDAVRTDTGVEGTGVGLVGQTPGMILDGLAEGAC
jgi:hypothetical protein